MMRTVKAVVMMNVESIIKEELMIQMRTSHQRNKRREVKKEEMPQLQQVNNKSASNNEYLLF